MEKLKALIRDFCESVNPVDGHASHFTDVKRLVLIANYALTNNLVIEEKDFFDGLIEKYTDSNSDLLEKSAKRYKIQTEEISQVIKIIKSGNL